MVVSVIVPVYNAEKYIRKCIDSLLQQTYKELEVLLIDDESKDNSGKICDEYASVDSRVKTCHKKNGGTAAARNTGLEMAAGDYVTFIDNDDCWNDLECLQEIVLQLKESNADVLMFSTIDYWQNDNKYVYPSKKCSRSSVLHAKRTAAIETIMGKGLLYCSVWSKVVKRKMIIEHNLFFTPGIRNEDTEWTAKLLLAAESYDWYEKAFYVYRKGHMGAQTNQPNTYQTVCDLKNIIIKYVKLAEKIQDTRFREIYMAYLSYPYAVWMAQAEFVKDSMIKADKAEMRQYSYVLKFDTDPRIRLVRKLYGYFGYHMGTKLLKLYMKSKYHIVE